MGPEQARRVPALRQPGRDRRRQRPRRGRQRQQHLPLPQPRSPPRRTTLCASATHGSGVPAAPAEEPATASESACPHSRSYELRLPVADDWEVAEAEGLLDVLVLDPVGASEIGDGSGDPQGAMEPAGAETEAVHGGHEEAPGG